MPSAIPELANSPSTLPIWHLLELLASESQFVVFSFASAGSSRASVRALGFGLVGTGQHKKMLPREFPDRIDKGFAQSTQSNPDLPCRYASRRLVFT